MKINKIPMFKNAMEKLTTNAFLSDEEKTFILSCAILFLKGYNNDNRLKAFTEFAYYIILKYSLRYNDFKPLFDFSSNIGYYPITRAIIEEGYIEIDSLNDILLNCEIEKFGKGQHIETIHQYVERNGLLNSNSFDRGYIAPTSFGKSSIIIEYINQYQQKSVRIAIIVPTKSLLMQTYRMIRDAQLGKKILIHDEMYQYEKSFIAVFTQERALSILRKNNDLFFDVIFIDEAHNILKADSRSILLSRLLRRNKNRNGSQQVIYLSPLIDNVLNLRIDNQQNISEHKITFNIKEPEIYEYKLSGEISQYNRFVNAHYLIGQMVDPLHYVYSYSSTKNFVYHYRPIKIENFCQEFVQFLKSIQELKTEIETDLLEVISILKSEVHEKFYGVEFLKYGIIYLHGKLPDVIKEYLESKFSKMPAIKYVVANMVILEGMNLPIDNLFIFNTHSLSGKDLTNLIGRVNRLNQIFTPPHSDLRKLLPTVHFVNTEKYNRADSNMTNKIQLLRSSAFKDDIDNPTLTSFDINKVKEEKKAKCRTIQINEDFLSTEPVSDWERLKLNLIDIGISIFYSHIDTLTSRVLNSINQAHQNPKWNDLNVIEKIAQLFVEDNIDIITDHEFLRLRFPAAQRYYETYITIAQKRSLNQNINWLFKYFKVRIQQNEPKTYFGSTYGETPLNNENGKFSPSAYVDLSIKSDTELINLAIVKLKIEDEFVSFKISKFVGFLYDYNLISLDDYNLYTYGTTNQETIALTKIGLNVNLVTRLQADDQLKNLYIDEFGNLRSTAEFNEYKKQANDFYRFEIERFIS